MIEIQFSKDLFFTSNEVFELIEDIHKLSAIKKEIRNYKIVREETGLQIIDNVFGVPFFKISSRLIYTTRPEKYCELKQIRGDFKEYLCLYTINEDGLNSELIIKLKIKLSYGPIGFIISKILTPLFKFRLNNELKAIEKKLKEIENHVKTDNSPK